MAQLEVTKTRWKTSQIVVIVIVSLIFLGIALLVLAANSQKSGVEFCPDDFSQREFFYAKIGWLNWTIQGITYDNTTSDFQQKLTSGGWIKPSGRTPKVWHLVEDSVSDPNSADFDSKILISYLDSDYWKEWTGSKKNKAKAKELWPAVATLARNNAYWAIPDLMDLGCKQSSISDTEFKAEIESRLFDGLVLCANSQLEQEDFEAAIQSFSDAISIKQTAEVLENRAQAYEKSDNLDLAAKDRQEAKRLGPSKTSEN